MSPQIFGIRHHGPGCARALRQALEALAPDVVLVEGPPDAEEVLPLAGDPAMKPPVALLIYPVEAPRRAVFYPFAVFSPEWQAIAFALERGIPVRFMDLPQRHRLAQESSGESATTVPVGTFPAEAEGAAPADKDDGNDDLHFDPIGQLSLAAGYSDRELWWEQQIEQRVDPTGMFEGIRQAMKVLRDRAPAPHGEEARREASMRQTIRTARKEGFEKIAVVCGAWHAPRLDVDELPAKADAELLKGLPRTKVICTWIPWTYSRLAYRSGYGAGVECPGWYDHLWTSPQQGGTRWIAEAARLLRDQDLDASSASVIEAVRLATALAVMREMPSASLAELNESILAVLCHGNPVPLKLVRTRLEIGDRLGAVPAAAPAVPLQRDLEARQARLRLKPTTEIKELKLDLRQPHDLEKSRLLHQLRILSVDWGKPQTASGATGTFREDWQLQWDVEFVVRLVEASLWGNTVETAAAGKILDVAATTHDLPALTEWLDRTLLADLPEAGDAVLRQLQATAAASSDVRHLMDALPPLARVSRYGNVRGTRSAQVLPLIRGFLERICVGLAGACASLDDDAAGQMAGSMGNVHQSFELLELPEERAEWHEQLRRLAGIDAVHGLVRGWSLRLLLEAQAIDEAELSRQARLALSPGFTPAQAGAWVEGLLRGTGLVLLQLDPVWVALDAWVAGMTSEGFVELLPILRRAFSGFQAGERRQMGEKVKQLQEIARRLGVPAGASPPAGAADGGGVAVERAELVLPVLRQILGPGAGPGPA